jgi:hypothetical protein
MSECKKCGRRDGHWLGCAEAPSGHPEEGAISEDTREHTRESECIADGCTEPRRSDDKRVKFCETHSDPKNRK